MFFLLSKVLDIFLCPYTWGVLLLAASISWRRRSRRAARQWRRRRAFGAAALAVLLLGGMSPFAHAIQWRMEHGIAKTYRDDASYDAIILLGGMVDEASTAETGLVAFNDAVDRVIHAHRLLREGKARMIIVSAGTNPAFPEHGEANVIARQLEDWGIARDRILVEDKARNTRENALFTQAIARARGFERVLVVTSASHMGRAVDCFHAIGMNVDTYPVDYRAHATAGRSLGDWIPRVDGLADLSGTLHELFGRLVYRVRGYGKPAAG